uniref:Uncharacterized protein n=1 Tax=Avena sativa TaxID=4498 RepID=A0ACD5ZLA4_AVESA
MVGFPHREQPNQTSQPANSSSSSSCLLHPSTPFVSPHDTSTPPPLPSLDRYSISMAAAAAAAAAAVSVESGTTRWCPTPEQLMILEEMYRGGLRTPNASQIQQITAHLANYGRIEGKNVFYWFQNHKARDRQKLRRRLCMSHHLLSCAHYYAAVNAGQHFLGAAAVAPMQQHQHQQYYAASCAGGGFDQHLIPAAVAPPTTAAYAAAGYGYPAFGAAAPQMTSRCAGGVNPSPPNPLATSFDYQGGVGSGGGSPEYSLGRLGSFGVVVEEDTCRSSRYEQQLPVLQTEDASPATTGLFCRPLKTLDLFPGTSSREKGLGC